MTRFLREYWLVSCAVGIGDNGHVYIRNHACTAFVEIERGDILLLAKELHRRSGSQALLDPVLHIGKAVRVNNVAVAALPPGPPVRVRTRPAPPPVARIRTRPRSE